jgi:hypothetical protein
MQQMILRSMTNKHAAEHLQAGHELFAYDFNQY